jgi:hypothetical protein
VLRTGTMISASDGNVGKVAPDCVLDFA